eukprot:TRINITY_DN31168_c0_g1_i1.p1 TRINITY_DN31168_c0_g1~~TRINITY_DN31168_c0_g1_i1.p1  ORF type:complete len:956 (+),score=177.54 TRINITY_DN31168_c0_g1_i1:77-2944(+)
MVLDRHSEGLLCGAWTVFWFVAHFFGRLPAQQLQKPASESKRGAESSAKQRVVYIGRLYRSQLYCCLAVAGGTRLLLRCHEFPADLLNDFALEHQVLFGMAFGHWMVSFWEDWNSGSCLAAGLDGKVLRGIRDPSAVLRQAYCLHHLVAALGYAALLQLHCLGAVGFLGLFFELPVLLLNRRELARCCSSDMYSGKTSWLKEPADVQRHWRCTYFLFILARGGAAAVYVYSLIWWSQDLDSLSYAAKFVYHGMALFFFVLNYSFLSVLDAWRCSDMDMASTHQTADEDEEEMQGDCEDAAGDFPVDPEAAQVRDVDPEQLASKIGSSEDLWLALDGDVYDLTQFQGQHPGGRDVLCQWSGRDATEAFVRSCPAAKNSLLCAQMARYLVGPLRSPPRQYRIYEHSAEEQRMGKLLVALALSFALAVACFSFFLARLRQAIGLGDADDPDLTAPLMPCLVMNVVVGVLALVLPLGNRLGMDDKGVAKAGSGGWTSHCVALVLLWQPCLIAAGFGTGWREAMGPLAPQGVELAAVALLLVEGSLSPALYSPWPCICLALGWYWRGFDASMLANCFVDDLVRPLLRSLGLALGIVVLTRLAAPGNRTQAAGMAAAAQKALWLSGIYAGLGVCGLCIVSPVAAGQLRQLMDTPLQTTCMMIFTGAAWLLASCAFLDVALKCSHRFASRCLALLLGCCSLLCFGLSGFRWLFAFGFFLHFADLGKANRLSLCAANFQDLPWHRIGVQAVWDSSRVAILGSLWRLVACNFQHVVSSVLPDTIRVYACEVAVPNYGEKVEMGVAAQFVPPKAKRRQPKFFVCNVGQIVQNCLPDIQKTMNTLVDVWKEFQDPALPGLCANVVAVFPTTSQGLAKEINFSSWETGKDAYDWYVKSEGHKKALAQHTSGILKTFGNLLASLEPKQPLQHQDRCRRCSRVEAAREGQLAPSACRVCGGATFRYSLF